MYAKGVGVRNSEEIERGIERVMAEQRWTRSEAQRHLLRLGLATMRLNSEAGDLLDALVGRLDAVAERLEASAGFCDADRLDMLDVMEKRR